MRARINYRYFSLPPFRHLSRSVLLPIAREGEFCQLWVIGARGVNISGASNAPLARQGEGLRSIVGHGVPNSALMGLPLALAIALAHCPSLR